MAIVTKKFDLSPKASESSLNEYFKKNNIEKSDIISLTEVKRSDGMLSIMLVWGKDEPVVVPTETTPETAQEPEETSAE